jgi:hypothetical protein
MGVWMIFISLFNAEVFLDVTVTRPHNKTLLKIYIFQAFVLSWKPVQLTLSFLKDML